MPDIEVIQPFPEILDTKENTTFIVQVGDAFDAPKELSMESFSNIDGDLHPIADSTGRAPVMPYSR